MTKIFLRNDDVYDTQDGLVGFCDAILENCFPLVLAVIPGKLTRTCENYLRDLQSKYPGKVVISQHGYKHRNHVQKGKFSEFNLERGFKAIRRDILSGKKIMEQCFDFQQTIFVPPWHGFSDEGIKALEDLGFSIISSGLGNNYRSALIIPMNISIDIAASYKPEKIKNAETYQNEISLALSGKEVLGIMTHHKMFSDQQIRQFIEVLDQIQDQNDVEFVTLPEATDNWAEKH